LYSSWAGVWAFITSGQAEKISAPTFSNLPASPGVKHRGAMDNYLTSGAIVIEFGLPAALIYVATKKPNARKIVAPVVGALTPLLLFYIVGGVSHALRQEEEPSMFMAVFVMSFFPYCVMAVAGAALGIFLPKNLRLKWRYVVAFFLGPAVGLGLVAVS